MAILAIPSLPLFYTYAIYKRHLGALEFRANRLLGVYSFFAWYLTLFVLVVFVGRGWIPSPEGTLAYEIVISAAFVVAAPALRARYQRWVDRLAYGAVYEPNEVIGVFANRIPTAPDREALVRLLADELTPSLLIRQSALYLLSETDARLLYARGIELNGAREPAAHLRPLLISPARYLPEPGVTSVIASPTNSSVPAASEPEVAGTQTDWVRLAIPLETQGKTVGLWMFGRRDPDDFYPQSDITLLGALANQVALAVENARLFVEAGRRLERLQALRNIDLAITASLDVRLTLNVLLDQVTTLLGVHAAGILLLNARTQILEYAGRRGFRTGALRHTHLRLGEGHAGRAALERRIISLPNLAEAGGEFARATLLAYEGFIAYFAVPLVAKGEVKGVLEIFHRSTLAADQEWIGFLDALAAQAAIAIDNAALFDGLQRSNAELALAYDTTLEGWSHALELRDQETEGHTRRVVELTLRLARAMQAFSEPDLVHVRRGALLHDIGKMGIPDSILLKPGPLTPEEWQIMYQHPVYANDLLAPIDFLRPALDIPYCHHEKWDGSGYPRGLKGELIPLAARVFAIVDVWDALCSDRPYRKAWPANKVREHIRSLSGTHFDPQIVPIFLRLLDQRE